MIDGRDLGVVAARSQRRFLMDSSYVSGGIYGWKEITESFSDFKDLLSRLRKW
jgi:hypothetical protein